MIPLYIHEPTTLTPNQIINSQFRNITDKIDK